MGNFWHQQIIDAKLYALLGERTAADNEKPTKKKKEKPAKAEVREADFLSSLLNIQYFNPTLLWFFWKLEFFKNISLSSSYQIQQFARYEIH